MAPIYKVFFEGIPKMKDVTLEQIKSEWKILICQSLHTVQGIHSNTQWEQAVKLNAAQNNS